MRATQSDHDVEAEQHGEGVADDERQLQVLGAARVPAGRRASAGARDRRRALAAAPGAATGSTSS